MAKYLILIIDEKEWKIINFKNTNEFSIEYIPLCIVYES